MFIDARRVERDSVLDAPVVIVGAGPSGLAAASVFLGTSIPVVILESGSLNFDAATQALAKGDVTGASFLAPHISRYRGFGGTAKRWAGFCRPLEAEDFDERPWIPFSSWPFSEEELLPYFQAAQTFAGIAETPDWNAPPSPDPMGRVAGNLTGGPLLPYALYRSPERNFGTAMRDMFRRAPNINIFLNANVTGLETNANGGRVEVLRVRCLNGNRFSLRPGHVILGAGGIENARLLLLSSGTEPCGIGNRHDLVGRFLMNHPYLMGAWLELADGGRQLGTSSKRFNTRSHRILLDPATTAEERMARFSAYLLPATEAGISPWARSAGFASLTQILGLNSEAEHTSDRLTLLNEIAADLPGVLGDVGRKLTSRWHRHRYVCVAAETEQVPNPESRVALAYERDALDQNRIRVDWHLDPIDKHTMKRGLELIGEAACRSGLARAVHYHEWLANDGLDTYPGGDWAHHAGTTRMSDDPKSGVVDRHGCVHGVENLHVTGCSVFPTEGVAPPTFTAMALAIRLARRLRAGLAVWNPTAKAAAISRRADAKLASH